MALTNVPEWFDLRCMSSDPNPEDTELLPDGISLFEKDTFKVFFFDKPNNRWVSKGGEVRS